MNPELSAARRSHVGRLLLELNRHFDSESLARLQARGHRQLTMAQKRVLPHLAVAGTRLTDLAERAGVSKQAMMKLVDGLEALGYVARGTDPGDARAKTVRLTRKGRRLLDDGLEVVADIEREYAALLGAAPFRQTKAALATLVSRLGLTSPDDTD